MPQCHGLEPEALHVLQLNTEADRRKLEPSVLPFRETPAFRKLEASWRMQTFDGVDW